MRILLFITSVYNTFEDIKSKDFIEIIDTLEKIAEVEKDKKIIISFCDETENRNILMNFFRGIIHEIDKRNIHLGKQFLGNVYYNNIISGGALLYDEKFVKEWQIANYVKILESAENFINLYYVDGCMNEDLMNDLLKDSKDTNCNFIKEESNGKGIIESLDTLLKKKSLQIE